ncbi:MAG: hypothetical protein HUU54_02615 [Ignavibacteriaceae bacterium]|nr:hypothetical protein [Ignavibacteriaceae bacterium]
MKNYTADWFKKILDSVSPEIKNYNRLSMGIAAVLNEIIRAQFDSKQKYFASLFDKKESEISKWLTGRHNFTLKTIAQIEAKTNTQILYTAFDLQNNFDFVLNTSSQPSDSISIFKISESGRDKPAVVNPSLDRFLKPGHQSDKKYYSKLKLVAKQDTIYTTEAISA